MLHRVLPDAPLSPPDDGMSITTAQFEIFLERKKSEQAVSLHDWARDKTQHGYALSFDDGYQDNFDDALPLLERYNVPATIFITTGFIDGGIYPLERWLWGALEDREKYESLRHDLKFGSYLTRLQKLQAITGQKDFKAQGSLFMNWDRLRELSKHPLITMGVHSHSHPALARSNIFQQWAELKKPIKHFKSELGFAPDIIAYPYGSNSMITRKLAQFCGYKMALGTKNEKVSNASDRLRLPRLDIIEAIS